MDSRAAPPALRWPGALAVIAALLGFVALTNRWLSWQAGFALVHANDERSYLAIANAAPGTPDVALPNQHAQRWVVHWLVGVLARGTGASVETTYRWASIVLAVAVALVLAAALMRLGVSALTGTLCLAVCLLNPYTLRFYGYAPGYLADLAFELGLATALLGLVSRRLWLVLLGAVVGVMSRQTMVPVLPVIAGWVAVAPEWRAGAHATRAVRAAATLVVPVAAFAAVLAVARGFSEPGVPVERLTILWALERLPGTAHDLLDHLAHVVIGLIVVGALLAATLSGTGLRRLPAAFWGPLLIGLDIALQSVLLSPDPIHQDYTSFNEPRETVMGLGALVLALAAARTVAERGRLARAPGPPVLTLGIVALVAGSLHQFLSVVSTGSAGATFALQVAVGAVLGVLVWVGDRRAAPEASLAAPDAHG